ncbi:MAG: MTH1187 family thiamine-binding protein [Candidatus Bathyarchaeia archaeon]
MVKNYLVMAEFSIVPVGSGETSVGRYVAAAILAFRNVEGLDFEVTSMGTILAANDLDTIFEAVRKAHEAVAGMGAKRVSSILKIDDRRDKPRSMNDKIDAVKRYMKESEANRTERL